MQPITMVLEQLPFRVFTRNQLLVSFLARMRSPRTGRGHLESRGEGVRRILSQCRLHAGREPHYRLLGDELLLTIFAAPPPQGPATDRVDRITVPPDLRLALAEEPVGSGALLALIQELRARASSGLLEIDDVLRQRIERYAYDWGGGAQRLLRRVLEEVERSRGG